MSNFKLILTSCFVLILLTNCKTIKQKTDVIVERENQKLNKFIGKGLSYKYAARNTGKAILIISDVCNVKNPKSSHLFAPLTSFPKKRVNKTRIKEKIKNIAALFL